MEIFLRIIALIILIASTFLFAIGLFMPGVGKKSNEDYAIQLICLNIMIVAAIYLIV